MLLLLACAPPDDTGSDDTGAPSGWSATVLAPAPFVAAAGDWALGADGRVIEIDAAWVDAGGSLSEGVRGAAARGGALWAVGLDGLSEWDGAWTTTALPAQVVAEDLAVRADGSVVVLHAHMDCDDCKGDVVENDLYTWDGAWTTLTPSPSTAWLYALAALDDGTPVGAGTDVAAWDGDWAWESLSTYTLWDIAASGTELVAVGDAGTVVRGAPGALTVETVGDEALVAAALDGGTAWVLGGTEAWYDDGGWHAVPLPEGTWVDLAVSDQGVVVVGDERGPVGLVGGASGFTEAWRETSIPVGPAWVDEDGAAWTAGDRRLGRWDASLTAWTVDGGYRAIDGASAEDIVAAGDEGFAEWDGAAWTVTDTGDDGMWWDVAVAPDGAAFAGGTRWSDDEEHPAVFARRTATGWEEDTELPVSAQGLVALVAFAEDEVYALTWGGESALLRWDGASWSVLASGLSGDPTVLWGRSGDELYLGGDGLWRWDGAALAAVSGAPAGVLGLAGDDDTLLVSGTDGWGDAYAPVVSSYAEGAWTELFRDEHGMSVGAGGGEQVVLIGSEGWRKD